MFPSSSPRLRLPVWVVPVSVVGTYAATLVGFEVGVEKLRKYDHLSWGLVLNADTLGFAASLAYVLALPLLLGALLAWGRARRWRSLAAAAFAAVLSWAHLLLLFYRLRTGNSLDFYFFWYNREDAWEGVAEAVGVWPLVLAALPLPLVFWMWARQLAALALRLRAAPHRRTWVTTALAVVLLANALAVAAAPGRWGGELTKFVPNHGTVSRRHYTQRYTQHLAALRQLNARTLAPAAPKLLGRHIFVIHLESISAALVNATITPTLMQQASEGVLFDRYYANSVQTIRVQESILCGLPPSLGATVVQNLPADQLRQLPCLPRLLSGLGYRTFFFKDHGLKFANTEAFMSDIGFDEIHRDDLMQPGDPETEWGYRDDIFYRRVFDYLERYRNQLTFTYIAVSATNHYPFFSRRTAAPPVAGLPHPTPTTFRQILANSTYRQDAYLGQMLRELAASYRGDSTFIIFGDNAWPHGEHPGNLFNEFNAYEENFRTVLLVLPPTSQRSAFAFGRRVDEPFSHMDILPTLVELSGGKPEGFLGASFAAQLYPADPPRTPHDVLAVQPYDGTWLSLVRYPTKYLINLADETVQTFDLAVDPGETALVAVGSATDHLDLIEAALTSDRP